MTSAQCVFAFESWGGQRKGAGRKPKGERALVSHQPREALASRHPVHVTLRLMSGLESLRKTPARRALERAFGAACERFGTRLVHYSIQSNHLHLLVEADGERALSRAMQGLCIRVAKALNKLWERRGKVFADRYFARILRTPTEVRNAIVYVLKHHARHGIALIGVDPFASARWFDGWRKGTVASEVASHIARAKTWLLRSGWRRGGLVGLAETPKLGGVRRTQRRQPRTRRS